MRTLERITTGLLTEPTGFHFKGVIHSRNIAEWVRDNLDKFNLNEPHSCKVTQFGDDITISGDEDIVLLVVKELEIIELDVYHMVDKIVERKMCGQDCTEAESAEIKNFVKEHVSFVSHCGEAQAGKLAKDLMNKINTWFPCEVSEALEEEGL